MMANCQRADTDRTETECTANANAGVGVWLTSDGADGYGHRIGAYRGIFGLRVCYFLVLVVLLITVSLVLLLAVWLTFV